MMTDLPKDKPCPHCGRFANRGVSIDAVITEDDKVLLVKRGVEPDKGLWATPGGYVDWNESAEDAVRRETAEETNLQVTDTRLVGVYSDPDRHPKQVISLVYVATVKNGEPKAGDDAQDAQWFSTSALPETMAFDHKQIILNALRQT